MRITTSRTYILTDNIKKPVSCVFMNRLGCWDSIQLTRNVTNEVKSSVVTYKRGLQAMVSVSNADRKITYTSQYLNLEEYERLTDMLRVGVIYLDNKLVVPATGTSFKKSTGDDFWTFDLVVTLPLDEPAINF